MTAVARIDGRFVRPGGEAAAAMRPVAARRRADLGRRRDTGPAETPRRFRPRLAAGFDDAAGDGLAPFDRTAPAWLAGLPVGAVLAAVATFAAALVLLGALG